MIEEIDFFSTSGPRSSSAREKKISEFVPDTTKRADFVTFGYQYFDSDDYGVGYGGYNYDGRYGSSVERMISYYRLAPGARVLEIGCAKGFILYEFMKRGMQIAGIDISTYAVNNAVTDVRPMIVEGTCENLPWPDGSFDLVYSKETLPHLSEEQLKKALRETTRVCKTNNIFLELQIAESKEGQDLIKAWDETHQCIHGNKWWRTFLQQQGFQGQVNFKPLF